MKKEIKINKLLLFALLIIAIIFVVDIFYYYDFMELGFFGHTRDLLIVAMLILFLILVKNHLQNIKIYSKIKFILLYVIIIYVIGLLTRRIDVTTSSFNTILISILSLTELIFSIFILVLIRELIFIQRRKNTNRNFNILLILIIIISFFPGEQSYSFSLNGSSALNMPTGISALFMILNLLMIYLMVINSFRMTWVKFLNKIEKIKVLLLSIIILIFNVFIILNNQATLNNYSEAGSNFFTGCFYFYTIYFSFSIIVVLLHLPTAGVYDRKVREISSLQHLSRYILGVFDINEVMQIITDQTIDVAEAHYCWFIVKKSGTDKFELVAQKNCPDNLIETFTANPDNDITKWIVNQQDVLKIDSLNKDKLTADIQLWDSRNGSLLGVPLLSGQEMMGILFAGKNIEYGFSSDDKTLLTMFANNAVIAIENARLVKKSLEKEKYEQELKVAHEAQMKLLPKKMPEVKSIEIEAACHTANEVGGDYYDFYEFDQSKLGIIIGDVSGKGAEAAFYMAEVKGIVESLSQIYFSPKELLKEANQILYQKLDSKTFVSVLYGIFNLKKREFSFCRAGHCPLLYWNSKKEDIYLIETPGLALGLDHGKHFEQYLVEEKISYQKDDIFVFYTDGVTEARNQQQEEFDEQRLSDIVFENHQENATGIKNAILEKVKSFVGDQQQHDDLTMVVIRAK